MHPGIASIVAVIAVAAGLWGCAERPTYPPIPADLVDAAYVPGIPHARQWGDTPDPGNVDLWGTRPDSDFQPSDETALREPLRVLALSGGGGNGAFAAGVLVGWSEQGTRPRFDIVTGISAGALAAPFAFLGSRYDGALGELFTALSAEDLVDARPRLLALLGDSLASAEPLRALIEAHVTEALVNDIAEQHRRGRRLFVGTTHVYAGRLVTWDIGEIASSGEPGSLELIRKVLLASASIPILLPPVYIDVEAKGQRYTEMHVDGSATRQVFVSPTGVDWRTVMREHYHPGVPEFYVIRNGRTRSEYMVMPPRLAALGEHALHLMAQSQGIGDLYLIYVQAERAGARYNAAWIGDDFTAPWTDWYDAGYSRALFEYGREQARSGAIWRSQPPGIAQAP